MSLRTLHSGTLTRCGVTKKPSKPCKRCGGVSRNKWGACVSCHKKILSRSDKTFGGTWEQKVEMVREWMVEMGAEFRPSPAEFCAKFGVSDRTALRWIRGVWDNDWRDSKNVIPKRKICKKCGVVNRNKYGNCIPCTAEKSRRVYCDTRAEKLEYYRNWRKRNPGYHKQWCEKNKEHRAEWERNRRKKNPMKSRLRSINYYRKMVENGGNFTVDEWMELCKEYQDRCVSCLRENIPLSPDHVVPVSKGGTSYISNIQPLCHDCNRVKSDKEIDYRKSAQEKLMKLRYAP